MKKKTNSRDNKASRPYFLLSSPILSQAMSSDAYVSLMADFFGDHPVEGFEQALSKLLRSNRFRKYFAATHSRIHEAATSGLSIGGLRSTRAWQIAAFTLKEAAEKLSEFEVHRDEIERSILCGDYILALQILDDGVDRFGEALWYVRTKLLLLSELKRTEELASYCETIQIGTEATLISSILHFSRVLTDTDSPVSVLDKLISTASTELRETRYEDFASLIELLFTPQPIMASRDYWPALKLLHVFPVIDQFVILERILAFAVTRKDQAPIEELDEKIANLAAATGLRGIRRLSIAHDRTATSNIASSGTELLELYDAGKNAEAAYYFSKNFKEIQNPLAYVNIIAKSCANAAEDFVMPLIAAPILGKLIKNLTAIYSIAPTANNAVESMASMIVRYHGMKCFPQLQLTLYKALPWRYETKGRNVVGQLALIDGGEVTPLSAMIAATNEFIQEEVPAALGAELPLYRILKRKSIELMCVDSTAEVCEETIGKYLEVEPRHKDRIELLSLYLLKSEQHQRLLVLAAHELVNGPTAYLVLPMDRLIQLIEENAYSDLAAVVISFYYQRYVSQQKDYVLNETLDDFLTSNHVDRPSSLLKKTQKIDNIHAVFYRDICVPEVLDYLSSFSSIHELFAERIKILDELSERQLIDSDARSAELEDIVSQVIIDTATNNLNGAKIAVDESALRKNLRTEVANLVNLFHQTQDANDDRFTITPDQPGIGKAHGYLSGARNAVILRLCNLVMESFLFDEKYGLDKTLSGEIRHGFFSNLMHARLEERKLLAETDANGRYRPNLHWREINHLINLSSMEEIEKLINRFGEKLNVLISEAESWMKIRNGSDGARGYLESDLAKDEFDKIRRFVEGSNDSEAVCNYIFSVVWKRVEASLAKIRDQLNNGFRSEVDNLFQELEDQLMQLKRHVALVELMGAIAQVRNGIKEDISTAAEWFRRAELSEIQAGTLEKAIAIAINSFERVKGAIFGIKTDFKQSFQYVQIEDSSVKPFILAFVNLLDNSYRHSGLWSRTQVRIEGSVEGGTAVIRISNDLSAEKSASLTPEILSAIRSKISNADSINLIRTEGGSGLVKAFNGISSLGPNTRLDVDCREDEFTAIVYYGT